MPKIIVDGKELLAKDRETILQVCERNGIYIPRYCYHPSLSIEGNCRMCLVEIEKMPKLQIACAIIASEGMIIYTQSEKVKKARQDVLEFLLINHPLDCPICDQVGECYLQDYYMEYGLRKSRFKLENKNLNQKRRDIGKYLVLDNERCILCTRCVRFCNEITKTNELFINSRGDHSFIDIKRETSINNNYSLNLADICPVGAITSKDFRFKERVYNLKSILSICLSCATGCRIKVQHNKNIVYRILPEPNPTTNTWICDIGRMSYKILYENRLIDFKIKDNFLSTKHQEGFKEIAKIISSAIEDKKEISMVLSNYLSIEDNLSLIYFAKEVLKTDKIYIDEVFFEQKIEDGILINTDKSPNSKFTSQLKKIYQIKNISQINKDSLVIGFYKDLLKLKLYSGIAFGWEIINQFDYIIPFATYFETEGSFINWQGFLRKTSKAVEPEIGILPLWKIISKLSSYFSVYPYFENIKDFEEEIKKFEYKMD